MKGMLIDDSGELQVQVKKESNGLITQGLVLGDITFQNQELIVLAEKGEFKEMPTKGVGISSYLDDETPDSLLRAIRTELSNEDMEVKKVGFEEDKIVIDAKYK